MVAITSFDLTNEMENIILKDKMISDITNSNIKTKSNETVEKNENERMRTTNNTTNEDDDDDLNLPQIRTPSGHITGSSYQCYEIDFEILQEYLKDYLLKMTPMNEELANEERVFEGYKFLLAKERKKLDIILKTLLEKYTEESKFMKMLRGLRKLDKAEIQEQILDILKEIYDYEPSNELSMEDVFTISQLKWSKVKIEIEECMKCNLLFDMRMDCNEIMDDILLMNDTMVYWNVLHTLGKVDEGLYEEYELMFENKDDEDEEVLVEENNNDDKSSEDITLSSKEEVSLENSSDTSPQEDNVINNNSPTTTDKHEKHENEDRVIPIIYDKTYRFTTPTGKLKKRLKDECLDVFFSPDILSPPSLNLDIKKTKDESTNEKETQKKDSFKAPNYDLKLPELPKPVRKENEGPVRSQSLPVGNFINQNTKRKICRSRDRIKSEGSIDKTLLPDKKSFDVTKLEKRPQKTANIFNIQTICVDGEMIKIADLSHRIGSISPRNQPRKLSFNTRSSLKRLPSPTYVTV